MHSAAQGGRRRCPRRVPLKAMLDWLTAQGRIPANSTLGQIDYGVEVESTGGQPATFEVTDFSVTAK